MATPVLRFPEVSALLDEWSCTSLAPSIQMYGRLADLERLAGEWCGDYRGDRDHLRRGTITFKLVAGDHVARGGVLVMPDSVGEPYHRVLPIRFVNTMDGAVNGVLDPYWDPDRETQAFATFRGEITDDMIEGTFSTRYANGAAEADGRWKITRGGRHEQQAG